MSENQNENSQESTRDFNVGISASLDIIIPVTIKVDPDKLKEAVIGEFEGVPVVDGEAFEEAGNQAEDALTNKGEVVEILGEIVGKAYRIKVLCPGWDKVEYIINKPMGVIR